ncbi:flagellar hook-associated protein FlgK [Candidatus Acetatifactor stercoripullorum]|uniref:flagellar hook-associated protein FlgK n=1 Tax=Candidatus Acetatifactor stercoripullorum TaxID=2838414 RepID=UPI00298E5A84|nr:flagellar hook-associated protein FlgK [Candidatus Acetatifactor stercoripullorum]
MPSTFFGLNTAYTGLLASNAALNTTSNNIANVQTEGYSRQQVVQQASNALRVFQTYGCAGAGVETLAIERVRDEFYDYRLWNTNAKLGEYEMKQYYMQQLETYFEDNGTNAGFKTVFDQLMITGMQELLKDPSSDTAKSQFVGYAGALAEYFNGLAGNLEVLQKDVNQEIKLKVDEINSLAGEIASLNKQINTIELAGGTANELRDRRSLLIDQLSQIVDVEVSETPIVDTNNPDRETGANRYVVKIAGGQVLVDSSEYNGLECVARTSYEKVNQTDIDGLYEIYWEDGQKFNLYNASMGGQLQGLIQLRDGNNGENFTGQVVSVGTTNGGQQDTVTIEVGQAYLQDLNKCNLSDQGGIINLGNQEFYYDSWEFTISYDGQGNPVYSYTFTLSDSEKNANRITNDRVGKTASIGSSISYQGIPYYMNQMNEWLRTFSQKFNDILTSGYTADNENGVPMFTGNLATDDEQFDFPDDTRYDKFTYEDFLNNGALTVNVADDSYYRITASNFDVLEAMELDPGLLATKYDIADGVEQSDLLQDLKDMAYDKDKMSFRGCSAAEFLQCVLADVALNASRANTFYSSYSGVANTIENQRLSISGVDEDEEAVNLVKYQNGYNLASKMIQTLTEVYDRLILETGV